MQDPQFTSVEGVTIVIDKELPLFDGQRETLTNLYRRLVQLKAKAKNWKPLELTAQKDSTISDWTLFLTRLSSNDQRTIRIDFAGEVSPAFPYSLRKTRTGAYEISHPMVDVILDKLIRDNNG